MNRFINNYTIDNNKNFNKNLNKNFETNFINNNNVFKKNYI